MLHNLRMGILWSAIKRFLSMHNNISLQRILKIISLITKEVHKIFIFFYILLDEECYTLFAVYIYIY